MTAAGEAARHLPLAVCVTWPAREGPPRRGALSGGGRARGCSRSRPSGLSPHSNFVPARPVAACFHAGFRPGFPPRRDERWGAFPFCPLKARRNAAQVERKRSADVRAGRNRRLP